MSDLVHLDNAATSFPKPDAVHRAVDRTARELGVSPGRSGSDLAVEAGRILDRTRALQEKHGARFDPAPLLERLARDDRRFYDAFGG